MVLGNYPYAEQEKPRIRIQTAKRPRYSWLEEEYLKHDVKMGITKNCFSKILWLVSLFCLFFFYHISHYNTSWALYQCHKNYLIQKKIKSIFEITTLESAHLRVTKTSQARVILDNIALTIFMLNKSSSVSTVKIHILLQYDTLRKVTINE